MKYSTLIAADRRLQILQLLALSGGYRANEYILSDALRGFGYEVSQDVVRSDLAWLAEQGVASAEQVAGVMLITLTERGLDVQAGRALIPGVKRPRPGQ
ncbi:MAG: ArsR family transcriptional regulator [Gammaproteobacteria bacterium]|nr:ArsR family transcriptional regulator [Gammaproteobacteria bacterium]